MRDPDTIDTLGSVEIDPQITLLKMVKRSSRADRADGVDAAVIGGGGLVVAITAGAGGGIGETVMTVVSRRDSSPFKDSKLVKWTSRYCTP